MLIVVMDNGIGILVDVFGKVFDFFFMIKVVGKGIGFGFS